MAWTPPEDFAHLEVVTATKLNTNVRDNMRELWHEVAYVEFTADVTNTVALETAPVDVVSAGAITFPAHPIRIEFFCPALRLPTTGNVNLWDGTTDLGRLAKVPVSLNAPWAYLPRRLTPTAASHTYKIRIWGGGNVATAHAGAGGIGNDPPGFIRILQKGGA